MFSFLDEDFFSKVKRWHVLAICTFVIVGTIVSVTSFMYFLPKYHTYVQKEKMRRTILWAETHEKAALQIGAVLKKYPEYSEYMLYQRIDSDLDELKMK